MTAATACWFSIDVDGQPPLPGWYDVLYEGENDPRQMSSLYWDGDFWRYTPHSTQCGFGNYDTPGERWRGAVTSHGGYYV